MFSKFYKVLDVTKPNINIFPNCIPIIDKNGNPLYPIRRNTLNKLVRNRSGQIHVDNCFGYYFKLNEIKDISSNINPCILGIDLGRYYDGYTVLGNNYNFNFQDNSNEKNIKNIKLNTINKNSNKRLRRSRLRHRRWNPKENKERIQYSLNYYLQKRMFIIRKFLKYFPITDIVIERLNHNPILMMVVDFLYKKFVNQD